MPAKSGAVRDCGGIRLCVGGRRRESTVVLTPCCTAKHLRNIHELEMPGPNPRDFGAPDLRWSQSFSGGSNRLPGLRTTAAEGWEGFNKLPFLPWKWLMHIPGGVSLSQWPHVRCVGNGAQQHCRVLGGITACKVPFNWEALG